MALSCANHVGRREKRILIALGVAALAVAIGLALCFWQNLPMKIEIVSVLAGLGFLFGLAFKIQAI